MEHLDEGTVHAWLDGALSPEEGRRIEEHLASCAECSALVAEARGLIAASSRILSALDDVPRVTASAAPTAPRSADLTVVSGGAARSAKAASRKKAWWARPQLSAAAVLMIVAVGSLVVVRNREVATPASLRDARSNAVRAPGEAPALPAAPAPVPNADSTTASQPPRSVAADAVSPKTSAEANARRALAERDLAASADRRASGELRSEPVQPAKVAAAVANDVKNDKTSDALARAREVSASSQGGATAVVAAPAVAPPPAAAKAVLDSAASSLARKESANKRKDAPASAPARAAADVAAQRVDAAAPRADTTTPSEKPQKVTRALDPNQLAKIEKERIQNEPKIENVVVTGAASARPFAAVRAVDMVGCWSVQRSAAARAAGIPERVELTARVVGRENGVEVRAARNLDAGADASAEWRWLMGQHGDVSLLRIVNGLQSAFPLLTSPDHRANEASRATRQECGAR